MRRKLRRINNISTLITIVGIVVFLTADKLSTQQLLGCFILMPSLTILFLIDYIFVLDQERKEEKYGVEESYYDNCDR